jgi:hypothetical protein
MKVEKVTETVIRLSSKEAAKLGTLLWEYYCTKDGTNTQQKFAKELMDKL